VKDFTAENLEPIAEEEEFAQPKRKQATSGKASIRQMLKEDEEEIEVASGRRSRSRRSIVAETPEQQFEVNDDEYTPSAFAGSCLSKKTRFGSTDN